MSRKYRDERNSRRNRLWLQNEIESYGPLPRDLHIRYARSARRLRFTAGFSTQAALDGAARLTKRLIPFKLITDQRLTTAP